MSFQEPLYLYLLLAGPLMVLGGVYALKRSRRRLEAFSRLFAVLLGGKPFARQLKTILLSTGAVVMIALALAGPERKTKRLGVGGLDILVVFDVSHSMRAQEGGLSRMDAAVRELKTFARTRNRDRLGLVAFAGEARLVCPLTFDSESFSAFLDELDVFHELEGGSALMEGLSLALDLSAREARDRPHAVVLVSDGEDLASTTPPEEAAARIRSQGGLVHAIMFGSPRGAKIPRPDQEGFVREETGEDVISRPNSGLMRRIADTGGGGFVAAHETAFPMNYLITEHMEGQRLPLPGKEKGIETRPLFQWFVAGALLLLLADWFLPFRRGRKTTGGFMLLLLLAASSPASGEDASQAAREGVRLFRAKDFASALKHFQEAKKERKEDFDLDVNLGLTHLKLGDPEKASAFFEKVLADEEGPAAKAARFGSGLASYRSAEFALNRSISLEAGDRASWLRRALHRARSAHGAFCACIEAGFWIEEAAVNLALVERRLLEIEEALKETAREGEGKEGDPKSGTGEEGEASSGRKEGGGGDEGETVSEPPKGTALYSPLTREDRMRIFDRLRELERERIALERAAAEAAGKKAKGGKDW